MVGWLRNHHQKDGNHLLHPFWSQNQLVPCLRSTPRLSGGDLSAYKSGQRTKGWPPNGFYKKHTNQNEKTTFRASFEPQGPSDRACVKEREILFQIALTGVMYDQMAPQLCRMYVRSVSRCRFGDLVFVWRI